MRWRLVVRVNVTGTMQYMQDVNAGDKRPVIDDVIADDVTPQRAVTWKFTTFAHLRMIGKQLEDSLDVFQPIQGRRETVTCDTPNHGQQFTISRARSRDPSHYSVADARPSATSRANCRRRSQSASVISSAPFCSKSAMAASSAVMCSAGTCGISSLRLRKASTAASSAASLEGNRPPATACSRYRSFWGESPKLMPFTLTRRPLSDKKTVTSPAAPSTPCAGPSGTRSCACRRRRGSRSRRRPAAGRSAFRRRRGPRTDAAGSALLR
jgi:hypothetical protein